MYKARDQVANQEWVTVLDEAATSLDLSEAAHTRAIDLFLSTVPSSDRSKQAAIAASLYAGSLIEGDSRSQSEVAEAVGVSRLTVQQRWKQLVIEAGLNPPRW